jgi:aspartyl-tRNA(Asn)/glutamyl-tRNA(Gln) amidotransferase subunit A
MPATNEKVADLSLTEAAAAIAARKVTSKDMTEACIARLLAHGDRLCCVAAIDPDAARSAASKADAELCAGRSRGLLHGVPLAHKDMFYRAGRASACGSRIRADFMPDVTATVLERLDGAGALDIARLNMVEFALGPTGHNEITGTPRNPWNTDHITGGSSSGPAAAVAARLIYASLGSDTGGSIRIPASCCGLVGIKPTYGRVSRYGALALAFSLDHVGPLTRTVADCALMLQIIAGHDPQDATTSARPVPDYGKTIENGVRGLRIGVPENYFYDPVTPDVHKCLDDSIAVYRRLGADIVPVTIPSVDLGNPLVTLIIAVEAAALHAKSLSERPDDFGRQTLGRLLPGLLYPATQYIDALNLRRALTAQAADAVFSKADVLHLPVIPTPVPTIAESDLAANPGFSEFLLKFGHSTRPFNYFGFPAISVPIGFTDNGLPSAMQLVANAFGEATLFRAARAYERETNCTAAAPKL